MIMIVKYDGIFVYRFTAVGLPFHSKLKTECSTWNIVTERC